MADESWKVVAAVVILIIAITVIFFEYRYFRRKRSSRARESGTLDRAHNAIITTRGIAASLERSGIKTTEARDLLRRAEMARVSGDNRLAMSLASEARETLLKEKKKQKEIGDLVKLAEKVKDQPVSEETTKERLQKDLPKNYLQAKFMLSSAQKAIEESGVQGRDVSEASRLLDMARKSFEDRDYGASLSQGLQAKRAAQEIVIEIGGPEPITAEVEPVEVSVLVCRSCGTSLRTDDVFCRKCGVKVERIVCASCGVVARKGDVFCRKCGVALL